jgi:hypothetical protein
MPARADAMRTAPSRPALLPPFGLAPVSGKSDTSWVAVESAGVGEVAGVSFSPPVSSVVAAGEGVSVSSAGAVAVGVSS